MGNGRVSVGLLPPVPGRFAFSRQPTIVKGGRDAFFALPRLYPMKMYFRMKSAARMYIAGVSLRCLPLSRLRTT